VNSDPPPDEFNGKYYTFTLECPSDEQKRTWLFFADGKEEKREWVQAFDHACRIFSSPTSVDSVFQTAFHETYWKIQRTFDVPMEVPRGSEQEILEKLIFQRSFVLFNFTPFFFFQFFSLLPLPLSLCLLKISFLTNVLVNVNYYPFSLSFSFQMNKK